MSNMMQNMTVRSLDRIEQCYPSNSHVTARTIITSFICNNIVLVATRGVKSGGKRRIFSLPITMTMMIVMMSY